MSGSWLGPFTPGQRLAPALLPHSPTSPTYQGSRKDKEHPRLGPKADGDQLAESRATAPSVWGDRVPNAVRSKTRLPATLHAQVPLRPASPGQAHGSL